MRLPWILAACVGVAACGSAEHSSPAGHAMQEISHDPALVQLPGWRNEGELPTGGLQRIAPEPDATYHAWSLTLDADADVMIEADGVEAKFRVLARTDRHWQLVSSNDTSGPIERQLTAGQYMVVVQAQAAREQPWRLSAACYGAGCPAPVSE